ncbi:MAG: putative RNA-binding protein with PUA-like domain [Phycisphaerales bacterium]|jgi:predicted RNA-binding protein with PUA-like domain
MTTYLIKTEPDVYSYNDLVGDKRTHWDGVANPSAQMFMRRFVKGDECFFYHTGNAKCVAGLARVVRGAYEDPTKPGKLASGETKFSLFDITPIKAAPSPLTLGAIKADPRFEGFELIRQSRLSVLPVPAKMDRLIRKLCGF